MIHSHTIQQLTEDEHLMLYSICERIFHDMGLQMNYNWIKMMRVDILIHFLNKIANIKEEFLPVRESLINKLKENTF